MFWRSVQSGSHVSVASSASARTDANLVMPSTAFSISPAPTRRKTGWGSPRGARGRGRRGGSGSGSRGVSARLSAGGSSRSSVDAGLDRARPPRRARRESPRETTSQRRAVLATATNGVGSAALRRDEQRRLLLDRPRTAAAAVGVSAAKATGRPRRAAAARRGRPAAATPAHGQPSTPKLSPARSIRIPAHSSSARRRPSRDSPRGSSRRKSPGRLTNVFSWRKKTVSSPTVDGPLAAADRDAADRRGRGRAERGVRLVRRVRALVERLLARGQLHGEGEAGRLPALLAVGVGQELEDLETGESHGAHLCRRRARRRAARRHASEGLGMPQHQHVGAREQQRKGRRDLPVDAARVARRPRAAPSREASWPPSAFQASSPTRQMTGQLSIASPAEGGEPDALHHRVGVLEAVAEAAGERVDEHAVEVDARVGEQDVELLGDVDVDRALGDHGVAVGHGGGRRWCGSSSPRQMPSASCSPRWPRPPPRARRCACRPPPGPYTRSGTPTCASTRRPPPARRACGRGRRCPGGSP